MDVLEWLAAALRGLAWEWVAGIAIMVVASWFVRRGYRQWAERDATRTEAERDAERDDWMV